MNYKTVNKTNSKTGLNITYCNVSNLSVEEVQTIRDALAVLTEEKAARAGIKWNNEGVREKLLLSFIGIAENMELVSNGSK